MNKSIWIHKTLALPRIAKRLVVLSLDASLCVLTIWLAFYLRLGEWVPMLGSNQWKPMNAAFLSVAIALPIFVTQGFYRAIFRYTGWPALLTVAKAMLMYGVVFLQPSRLSVWRACHAPWGLFSPCCCCWRWGCPELGRGIGWGGPTKTVFDCRLCPRYWCMARVMLDDSS